MLVTDGNAPLKITSRDLAAPEVEDYVASQAYLRRDVSAVGDQGWVVKVIYANWFYLAVCSAAGALAGWACVEPFIDDSVPEFRAIDIFAFGIVTGFIGLFLGAAEGLMCRNVTRALLCGSVGLGIGLIGGVLLWLPTEIFYVLMSGFAETLAVAKGDEELTGIALLVHMMGRAAAWALAAVPAGLGQGIALRERKVVLNGLLGGVLGGLIGGFVFDPIFRALTTADGQATLSRAVGFAVIGLFVGLFVGLIEGWTKAAWLLMRKGPLAGKQFILFKDTTILGSSPKAEVYLFKDDAIEPRHAVIYNRGGRFELEDCNTPDGTYVNGIPIKRQVLRSGDQIVLGKTVLEFSLRETAQA